MTLNDDWHLYDEQELIDYMKKVEQIAKLNKRPDDLKEKVMQVEMINKALGGGASQDAKLIAYALGEVESAITNLQE